MLERVIPPWAEALEAHERHPAGAILKRLNRENAGIPFDPSKFAQKKDLWLIVAR